MYKDRTEENVLARGGYEWQYANVSAFLRQKFIFVCEILFRLATPLRILAITSTRLLGVIFFHYRINGLDNLEKAGSNALFVANHHSRLDPFFISSAIPFSYFRKTKAFRFFAYWKQVTRRPYGPLIWLLGAYPVYQYGGDYARSLRSTIEKLRNGQSVLMFPTAHMDEEFEPKNARPGVAYVARETDPLIVPVRISNLYKFNLMEAFLGKYKVTVTFGQPFRWREAAGENDSLGEAAKKLMKRVKDLV